jgi:hypothetical protein
MKIQEFNKLLDKRIEKMRATLASKGKEYGVGDRLHNFKIAGRIGGVSPELALKGMLLKHVVSVFDIIDMCEKNEVEFSRAMVDEKLGDSINYLVLLEALIIERLQNLE